MTLYGWSKMNFDESGGGGLKKCSKFDTLYLIWRMILMKKGINHLHQSSLTAV